MQRPEQLIQKAVFQHLRARGAQRVTDLSNPIPVSPGVLYCSLPSGESEPSVTLASTPGESIPTSSTGGPQEALAGSAPSNMAKPASVFVLDVDAFMKAINATA